MTAADTEAPQPAAAWPRRSDRAALPDRAVPISRRVGRWLAELDRRPRTSLRGRLAPGTVGRREATPAVPDRRSPDLRHVRGGARVATDRPRPSTDPAASARAHDPGRPRPRTHRHRDPGPALGSIDCAGRVGRPARGRLRVDHPRSCHRGWGSWPAPAMHRRRRPSAEAASTPPASGRPSARPTASPAPGASAEPTGSDARRRLGQAVQRPEPARPRRRARPTR